MDINKFTENFFNDLHANQKKIAEEMEQRTQGRMLGDYKNYEKYNRAYFEAHKLIK